MSIISNHYLWSFGGALLGSLLTSIFLPLGFNWTVDKSIRQLTSGSTTRNPWLTYLYQYYGTSLLTLSEIGQRAHYGKPLEVPYLCPHRLEDNNNIYFNQQLSPPSNPHPSEPVDTNLILGGSCLQPLHLASPLIIAAPAGGPHLSAQALQALIKAASYSGSLLALDSQQQALPDIPPGCLYAAVINHTSLLKQSGFIDAANLLIINYSDMNVDLSGLVISCRNRWEVPIAVRIMAGNQLTDYLAGCIKAEVDAIIIRSNEADYLLSPRVTASRSGMPMVYALAHSVHYLQKHQLDKKIAIITEGGGWSSSDFLPCIAQGASGVMVSLPALYALLHGQEKKAAPWQPLSALYLEEGKKSRQLNTSLSAQSLCNYLDASNQEMAIATRLLGKTRVLDLSKDDLITTNLEIHRVSGIPLASNIDRTRSPIRL